MNTDNLDNPTWYSLTETHQCFSLDYQGIKFYKPEYCPFGGFTKHEVTKEGMDSYALLTDNFYVVGEKPVFSDKVLLKKELVCKQMVLNKQVDFLVTEHITKLETAQQRRDLSDLVNGVQPGYFASKTPELGNYYGIYKEDRLVAVTGERMKMHAYTEISAVVTHPEHTGKGYAKQLVAFTSDKILSEGKTPYLHVAETNVHAIALYEKMGFFTRRKISFWNFTTRTLN